MNKFLIVFMFLLVSCASSIPMKKDKTHDPLHGGIILKGDHGLFLEVVGSHKSVQIYPLRETDPVEKTLTPIPLKEVKLKAEYSPRRSKADWSINLRKAQDHFYGKVNERGEHSYAIYVDMQVGKKKEYFIYVFRKRDLDEQEQRKKAEASSGQ